MMASFVAASATTTSKPATTATRFFQSWPDAASSAASFPKQIRPDCVCSFDLNMVSISIECEIPKEIGNITLLNVFHCEHNNFTGSIPPQVFNISALTIISLTSNFLSGQLPSDMGFWLPNLQGLYLDINQFVGPFPMSISNASKLILLDMSSNYFSGPVPVTLGNLRNLKFLNMELNNLTSLGMDFLSSLTNCKDLEILTFDNNPLISGELPSVVGNLSSSLQMFYGSACDIWGSIPSEISNLSRLINIQIGGNKFTGRIPTTIGGLKELQSDTTVVMPSK
ncbi:hypothetical protein V6N13_049894 [Hibiscus sabdariffa]